MKAQPVLFDAPVQAIRDAYTRGHLTLDEVTRLTNLEVELRRAEARR